MHVHCLWTVILFYILFNYIFFFIHLEYLVSHFNLLGRFLCCYQKLLYQQLQFCIKHCFSYYIVKYKCWFQVCYLKFLIFSVSSYSSSFLFLFLDACGGIINAPNGTIHSPSFPQMYPPNKNCIWQIQAPEKHRILLNFTHFQLEGRNVSDNHILLNSLASLWHFLCNMYYQKKSWLLFSLTKSHRPYT